jgi:hypothetical protein
VPSKSKMKLVLLAGLPRTGSTLLQNILIQNPKIQTEGNSALCQVMSDAKNSCEQNALHQLIGVGKDISFKESLLRNMPSIYYPEFKNKVVIDKCRMWVSEPNISLAREYISKDVKAIVLYRPIEEIVASYAKLYPKNRREFVYASLLNNSSDFLREIYSTYEAKNSNDPNFLFVSYDDITLNTEKTLSDIYKHIGLDRFIHNTRVINQTVFEDDERNNVAPEMHIIRPKIEKQINPVILPDRVKAICRNITNVFSGCGLLEKIK